VAIGAVASLGAALFAGLGPTPGGASSHREAPLTAADPQVDNTDVYAFVSPDKTGTVTLISSWLPFQEPAGGPNFYAWSPDTQYDIRIDNDGDAKADLLFRWVFDNHYRNPNTFLYNTGEVTGLDDPELNFYQTYDLRKITFCTGADDSAAAPCISNNQLLVDDGISVPSFVGDVSMPDYEGLSRDGIYAFNAGKSRTWVGQSEDPFFLDLRVFDLLYGAPSFSEVGDDTLAGFSASTLAVQVPKEGVAFDKDANANPIVGVWSTAYRRTTRVQHADGTQDYSGAFVGVSRLGMPLVNEVVVPVGLKDYFNASVPKDDAQFLGAVNDPELPHLIEALYGIPAPDSDPNEPGIQRDDLIAVFLTGVEGLNQPPDVQASEQLRINMSIPPCRPGSCAEYSRLGVIGGDVAGFPNGRRLADDIIDISLQVVEGELIGNPNDLGDGVDQNDVPFLQYFPYVALPVSGSDQDPH
jgi:hypothetical protein